MTQLGPAEATIDYEGGIPLPFARVTVLPCGLVHIVPRFGSEFTIPATAVKKIAWADERTYDAKERQESAIMRDAESPVVEALSRVEFAVERLRDPSLTG